MVNMARRRTGAYGAGSRRTLDQELTPGAA